MDTTRFNIIALLFTGLALLGLPRLLRGWRALLAPEPSAEGEALAVYVAVFLMVPLATLAHELGHLVTARALGAAEATLYYRIFWGYVEYTSPLPGHGHWWVALAGNAVSWALAALGLLVSRAGLPPGLRSTARIFGMFEMVHTLIAYPLMSLGNLPGADWSVIYGRPFWAGTGIVAAAHAASLIWLRRELRGAPVEAGGDPALPPLPVPPHSDCQPGEQQDPHADAAQHQQHGGPVGHVHHSTEVGAERAEE